MRFTIPADPDQADALAGELRELATATEWRRAAIVYSRVHVRDSQGRPTEKVTSDHLMTPAEYAEKGVYGLRSRTTIRASGGPGIRRSPMVWPRRCRWAMRSSCRASNGTTTTGGWT